MVSPSRQLWDRRFHAALKKYFDIEVGIGSYGYMGFPAGSKIGNYCSIAAGVKFLPGNHPVERISTAACFYNPILGFVGKKYDIYRATITIGNDVWIGANVLITNKCTSIGNGAVIGGGGSCVTHDVPPYSIVAGNPAEEIRKRFAQDIIAALEDSRWWELPVEVLVKFVNLMNSPLEFCAAIEKYK